MRRLLLELLVVLLAAERSVNVARAQTRCFPETRQCVSAPFEAFWTQNGGLPVFGFPITTATSETNRDTGRAYLTQWFERSRFENHPENMAPYNVLLGRIGDDRLRQLGREWQVQPREAGPRSSCLWFAQTGHNVCNQVGNDGFRSYWATHGLQDPKLSAYQQSLALFGLPLTTAPVERNSSGDTVLTQWFERGRFEWHPNNPEPYKVLLGRLGAELWSARGSGLVDRTHIYLIALEDNGRSGKKIGCGDSVVPVEVPIVPTRAPLRASLEALLAVRTQFYGQSGLYNALYQSNLRVDSITIAGRKATVNLTGMVALGGVCDDPRFGAQLTETTLQFPTIDSAAIFINGRPLASVLAGR